MTCSAAGIELDPRSAPVLCRMRAQQLFYKSGNRQRMEGSDTGGRLQSSLSHINAELDA